MEPAKTRAPKILARLAKTYPDARCELDFTNAIELLVGTILAAQCTDVRVNEVTKTLFKRYKSAKDYAKADMAELESIIRTCGFFRNKARSIQNCCTQLVMEHGGKVPEEMEKLTALSGVGRKTANVIRGYVFHKPVVICDTHMIRLANRMGFTKKCDPETIEEDLMKLLPDEDWTKFSSVMVIHGRRCCNARKPECNTCPVEKLCPRIGVD